MLTKINQVHMDQIAAMRIQAANGQIGYWQIYQTLAILLQTDYGYEATNPTVLWLRGATEANAGRGSMSELIRVYSSTQAMLRYGETVSESKMQEASNEVAKNLLKNLLSEGDHGVADYPIIPDIKKLLTMMQQQLERFYLIVTRMILLHQKKQTQLGLELYSLLN
ncbi:hypothetical protein [Acinetobacter lactucae]|uniref:hypothetical protein n=1 Tax=Acinetobacter lactucae TaxID=1785128 RepID=UPI000F7862A7|nr:hypothetical protein [Acinetobacter lactucae]RSO35342.1 hypothetical protein EA763_07900 [Acinetobacter lactucae]